MCFGAELVYGTAIAAALSAAGAGVNAYAQSQQLKKQNDIAAAGIIKQGQIQQEGQRDVGALTQTVAQSNAAAQAKSAQQLAAIQKALQAAPAVQNSNAASPDVPGASKAYKQEQAQASGSAQNYVNAIANSAATTQGTQLERVGEGEDIANTATQLGGLQQQSNEQNYVTKLQVEATQENPWLKSLGMLLQGAGAVGGALTGGGGLAAGAASGLAGTATDAAIAGLTKQNMAYGQGMASQMPTVQNGIFGDTPQGTVFGGANT